MWHHNDAKSVSTNGAYLSVVYGVHVTAHPPRPPVTEHRWPDPDAGPWVVVLRWGDVDGRPECVGLDLGQLPDGDQPKVLAMSSVLRQLPVAEWIAADRAGMIAAPTPGGAVRQSTLERLQVVADVYRAAAAAGDPPVLAVAARFEITKGGAAALVSRARQVGLLPPTSQGVANAGK